jgi:NADPH-dependent glutamate synthase beta subunit-like oxidoreductase
MHRVWAGGDIVIGAATVIPAMGAGRQAAGGAFFIVWRTHKTLIHHYVE